MKRRYLIVAFLFVSITLMVEAQHRRSSRVPAGNDLAAAKQNILEAFNARATKCGDSYFTRGGNLFEMKGCTPVLRVARSITEADRLNGILWAGQIDIQCAAWRVYPNGQWNDWGSFLSNYGFLLSFDVWKTRNGFHNQKLNIEALVKADCPKSKR